MITARKFDKLSVLDQAAIDFQMDEVRREEERQARRQAFRATRRSMGAREFKLSTATIKTLCHA
jgi:hypothetical protein